ncbi:hypothetical protein TanjilG_07657 [Lupinus angustifolius]|uniref:non-specific serine/threonine protein kinase n=1 Tax=Lupinus angustifolius TaxID=3871 RepID=A0A1J7H069_LUPAN|nr:hypothetical protein TanjilG_07657 [Lupinus angustifolius]
MSSPHNSSPDNATPDNSTPDDSIPDDSTPDNSKPNNSKPHNSTPDNSTPDNATPDNSDGKPNSSSSQPGSNESPTTQKSLPNGKAASSGGKDDNKAMVGAAVGVVFVLLILVIVCNNYYNSGASHPNWSGPNGLPSEHAIRMHQSGGWGPEMNNTPSSGLVLPLKGGTFTYEELADATNNFANENIVGQGGFGYVHKGVLHNGKEVAVKSLKSGSGQGEREFQAEIDIISRVHHRHLVSLVGYCIWGGQRMLVYEYVQNQTLEHHLHGKGVPTMDWPTRMRIAVGSAKGLAYLHEDCHPRIIHRDIKASNVLLDASFEAKVADFGLAKLTTDNNTHVSTRVMGTFGYLAPEYASSGKLTEKSDVFSFGIMLLELITGKRPLDLTNTMEDSLVDWARPLLSRALEGDGNFGELVDPFLEGNYNSQEMARMVACAAASIRHSAKKRAKMSQIVRVLEGDVSLEDLKEGVRPTSSGQSSTYTLSSGSPEYDTMQYNADMIKFRQQILFSDDSIEISSKEYGHH